jgi:hypothetical protein
MATKNSGKEWLISTLVTTLVAGLIGGLGSTIITESYFRPQHFRSETRAALYRETYNKRVDSYQTVLGMFSQAYWLERSLTAESSEETRRSRRLVFIEQIQRELGRLPVVGTLEIHGLAFKALDYYIENFRKFTPDVRRKWIDLYYSPLLQAMRRDLYQDEIRKEMGEQVFPESLEKLEHK